MSMGHMRQNWEPVSLRPGRKGSGIEDNTFPVHLGPMTVGTVVTLTTACLAD